MQCPQTDKSYPYLRKADSENPHRSVGQQVREEWKPRCLLLGWVWEASGGLGKATDVGDRHRGERVLVEHASHCKASSGHAKTYYCWHGLTSGLTAFPASIGTLQHAQISATQHGDPCDSCGSCDGSAGRASPGYPCGPVFAMSVRDLDFRPSLQT